MVAESRILVVDDEPAIAQGCQRVLANAGYRVESATNGRDGLRRATEERFDLVMADLKLPDLDGMELVRALRIQRPETAIVIITGHSSVDSAIEAVRLGVRDYITKPFTPDQITDAIARALAPENPNRPGIEASVTEELCRHAKDKPVFGQHLLANIGEAVATTLADTIRELCARHDGDRERMIDIVRDVQRVFGCVSGQAMELIAKEVSAERVDVESVVSFYAALSKHLKGEVTIRLSNDIINEHAGAGRIGQVLQEELGIPFGKTTPDGQISLDYTSCIGMNDQAPAALVNDVVVTRLTEDSAREMIRELKSHRDPLRLVKTPGDGNNAHPLVRAMVRNNLRQAGPVIFAEPTPPGRAIRAAVALAPEEIIDRVEASGLRGRGGAGFPTAIKWRLARESQGDQKYLFCNADEGEPGTFKDRVILTERPDRMFEGMTIAAYAIGAEVGIVYLRGEYTYLKAMLDDVLARRRQEGLLGTDICGHRGFNFDIRIHLGAGAYICGEETALISSFEGLRGDPKTRPPFPVVAGYRGLPTVVNNVETFCCVARIAEEGPQWFSDLGEGKSAGTKLLSVSGDCDRPGVYEVPFGIKLSELIERVGAKDTAAIQVGGPSGVMVAPDGFNRAIAFDDLATGGSVMIFNSTRDVLAIAANFLDFFIEESCGFCTPCRVGNVLLRNALADVRAGRATPEDLDALKDLGSTIRRTSRCGLGQTSPNPVLSTLENFPGAYEALVRESTDGLRRTFDIDAALQEARAITGRGSNVLTK